MPLSSDSALYYSEQVVLKEWFSDQWPAVQHYAGTC